MYLPFRLDPDAAPPEGGGTVRCAVHRPGKITGAANSYRKPAEPAPPDDFHFGVQACYLQRAGVEARPYHSSMVKRPATAQTHSEKYKYRDYG